MDAQFVPGSELSPLFASTHFLCQSPSEREPTSAISDLSQLKHKVKHSPEAYTAVLEQGWC